MSTVTVIDRLKQHKFFSEFFTPAGVLQFKKYLIVGFTTFGIEYTLFATTYYLLWHNGLLDHDKANTALASNIVGYSITFVYNFLLNRYWSFQSKSDFSKQLFYYAILFGLDLLASCAIVYLLTPLIGPWISKLVAMGAVVSWNFIFYKKIIYKY